MSTLSRFDSARNRRIALPVAVLMNEHPLRAVVQELQLHRQCVDLPLTLLSKAAVEEYLAVRFAKGVTPARFIAISDDAPQSISRGSLAPSSSRQVWKRPPLPNASPDPKNRKRI